MEDTTTTRRQLTARTQRHEYSSGRPFWMAHCPACLAVLNSGHHYKTEEAARRECEHHNAEHHHTDPPLEPCNTPLPY